MFISCPPGLIYYRPPKKLREGNVFTPVCQSKGTGVPPRKEVLALKRDLPSKVDLTPWRVFCLGEEWQIHQY